ncbi:MAG: hypothetical protein J6Y20_10105 [Lachnospiraceae bacterium]|nr:hypothetical protein [Lachnospiraceae bacterium]MBP5462466.1 hypothetical protein [Lachnospiraceae bacterium]
MEYVVTIEMHGFVEIPVHALTKEQAQNKAFDILAETHNTEILDALNAEVYTIEPQEEV